MARRTLSTEFALATLPALFCLFFAFKLLGVLRANLLAASGSAGFLSGVSKRADHCRLLVTCRVSNRLVTSG